MADVSVAANEIVPTGSDPTALGSLSVSDTYQFINNGRLFIHVDNAGGSSCNVTITTFAKRHGLALADRVVAVANGVEKYIGPFDPEIYNNADGEIEVTLSFITSVTILGMHF